MKPGNRILRYVAALGTALAVFSSCIGVGSDITIRPDGSGSMTLEYRMSRSLESLGKLDGNERWPPIPSGRADFERTAARIEGLKLRSFSAKTTEEDVIHRLTVDFSRTDALLQFLDATGQSASLSRENGKHRLSLTLSRGAAPAPDLVALIREAAADYRLDLAFTLPADAELAFFGEGGRPLGALPSALPSALPVGEAAHTGRKVSYSAPIGPLLCAAEPLVMEIRW
ncbi:MAG: hypothetical protein LBD08_05150 [Treponema sp.]|nr:hypothetical protein [Treponema sp.]